MEDKTKEGKCGEILETVNLTEENDDTTKKVLEI
jgi:hypothetical protein